MNKTKDQQAQEYAEKKSIALRKAWYLYRFGEIDEGDDWENDPVRPSDNFGYAFNAGYTAAEQSDLRISVAKLRGILNELASVRGVVNESVDEIINRVKKEI